MGSDQNLLHYSLLSLFLMAPATYLSLLLLQAPYGKHHRTGWGPEIPTAAAWFLMESPAVWLPLLLFPAGRHRSDHRAIALVAVYLLHYVHRTCIYPFRLHRRAGARRKSGGGGFPASIALMAFSFNLLNAYVQVRWASHYADYEVDAWFWWRFLGGLAVFIAGMAVNIQSDLVLVSLKGDDGGYKVPKGGWFELVSCPNYFGEIVEWLGWALMTGSWAGIGFFLYTCSNLVPRARANHRWYLEKFGEDYPKSRKAVFPFLY